MTVTANQAVAFDTVLSTSACVKASYFWFGQGPFQTSTSKIEASSALSGCVGKLASDVSVEALGRFLPSRDQCGLGHTFA